MVAKQEVHFYLRSPYVGNLVLKKHTTTAKLLFSSEAQSLHLSL